ncbi:MAG: hypothetical protein IPK26_26365 [Planctomycetes bacterium]|nr:hypothetical protein [Planctomycetota bacterium]
MEAFCASLVAIVSVAFTLLYRHDAMRSVGHMGEMLRAQHAAEATHVRDMAQVMRDLTAYAQASFKALEGRCVEAQERAQHNERQILSILLNERRGPAERETEDTPPVRRARPAQNGNVNTFTPHPNAEGHG